MSESPIIRHLLTSAVQAGMTGGAITIVKGPANSFITRAGHARLQPSPRFVTRDTVYDLASLTKVLATTSLFLIASRSNDLSLETRVGEFLPRATDAHWHDIHIEHLLTHTSGFPAWAPLYALSKGDPTKILETLVNLRRESAPGERVAYSCPGFILLGLILEQVLSMPLDRAFRTLIAEPLGIENSLGFHSSIRSAQRAGAAMSTDLESTMVANLDLDCTYVPPAMPGFPDDGNARFLCGVAGNAGLFGTVESVLTLAESYLPNRDSLFSRSEILMVSHDRTHGLEANRGLGWQMANSPGCSAGTSLSCSSFGHTGFTGTSLWIDPDREMICILLANRHHPEHRLNNLHPLRRRFHTLATTLI